MDQIVFLTFYPLQNLIINFREKSKLPNVFFPV
jgi:hypothetical protein